MCVCVYACVCMYICMYVYMYVFPSVRPSQLEWGTAYWQYSAIDGDRQQPRTSARGVIDVAEHEPKVRF